MKFKTIAITGCTGFLGQALIPFILKEYKPKSLRLLGRSEFKLTQIIRGEGCKYDLKQFRPMITDIRDLNRLISVTKDVDLLIHCAALKRLEIINYCPQEAIYTNCVGSANVLHCVINNNIPNSVWISSDKAVYPTNLYGATKKVMEEMVIQRSVNMGQKVAITRYGNVIFSTGALTPFIIERIKRNEDLPLTDTRMSRFLVTKRMALDTVKRAIESKIQGEVVLPKEIYAINIERAMHILCEYFKSNSRIRLIGIYPGEKLAEEIDPGIKSDDPKYQVTDERYLELLKEDCDL